MQPLLRPRQLGFQEKTEDVKLAVYLADIQGKLTQGQILILRGNAFVSRPSYVERTITGSKNTLLNTHTCI